jgi:hypothetical protein
MMTLRDDALRAIEQAKAARGLENPLDMGIRVPADSKPGSDFDTGDLADLLGVSRFAFANDIDSIEVDDLSSEPRCMRSWKRDGTVSERSDGGMLTDRDAAAVGVA